MIKEERFIFFRIWIIYFSTSINNCNTMTQRFTFFYAASMCTLTRLHLPLGASFLASFRWSWPRYRFYTIYRPNRRLLYQERISRHRVATLPVLRHIVIRDGDAYSADAAPGDSVLPKNMQMRSFVRYLSPYFRWPDSRSGRKVSRIPSRTLGNAPWPK